MTASDLPVVSVVMAEYNTAPQNLREAIESILDQTEHRFELVLVDDGSRTDVKAVVEEFNDPRVRVVGYGENRGFVAALNYGWQHARAELIARMDTDDTVEPTYLAEVMAFAEANPQYAVVSAQAVEITGGERTIVVGREGEVTPKSLMRGGSPVHAASLIRREALEAVGGYRDYHRAEDLALWCEILLSGRRMITIPKVLYNYRVDEADFGKRKLKNRAGEIRVRLRYYPMLGAGPVEYARILVSIVSSIVPVKLLLPLRKLIHPASARP